MTDRTTATVPAGRAAPVRHTSQRELVLQSLIRRPGDATGRRGP